MRAELQKVYILHTRPYGDTSVIASCLTESHGRIPILAKGVRNKKIKQRQYLHPFTPLLMSWQGKSGLKTLTHVETQGAVLSLQDKRLYCGFYLNELLMRLMPEHDDHPRLFDAYEQALGGLHENLEVEPLLRSFEFVLIEELGYGVNFHLDCEGQPIHGESNYAFVAEQGFVPVEASFSLNESFWGGDILAIAAGDYREKRVMVTAKYLSRRLMKPLLGRRPLKSRELFASMVVKKIAKKDGEQEHIEGSGGVND